MNAQRAKFILTLSRYLLPGIEGFLVAIILFISIQLVIAAYHFPQPQAILTLGGGIEREQFTAQFAKQTSLDIWVSSGAPVEKANRVFQDAKIDPKRLYFDTQATDTVTNFTTIVPHFRQQDIHHVYLITSDFHMPRATAIAFFVFGSQGIVVTPIALPSHSSQESPLHILRDIGRSILWIILGRTGASFRTQFD